MRTPQFFAHYTVVLCFFYKIRRQDEKLVGRLVGFGVSNAVCGCDRIYFSNSFFACPLGCAWVCLMGDFFFCSRIIFTPRNSFLGCALWLVALWVLVCFSFGLFIFLLVKSGLILQKHVIRVFFFKTLWYIEGWFTQPLCLYDV